LRSDDTAAAAFVVTRSFSLSLITHASSSLSVTYFDDDNDDDDKIKGSLSQIKTHIY
jgi:hypothetical protein